MYYGYPYYRSFYPLSSPYGGFGGFGGYGGYGGYGGFGGINAIGSQFNNQSLVNTGSMIGSSQTQSPINIW